MYALIFTVMWANHGGMHLEPPAQFFTREQCVKVGELLEESVPQRHGADPRGMPTAIHWWCVETNEGGVI